MLTFASNLDASGDSNIAMPTQRRKKGARCRGASKRENYQRPGSQYIMLMSQSRIGRRDSAYPSLCVCVLALCDDRTVNQWLCGELSVQLGSLQLRQGSVHKARVLSRLLAASAEDLLYVSGPWVLPKSPPTIQVSSLVHTNHAVRNSGPA